MINTHAIGEIAAAIGVIGSIVYVVLWSKNIRALREIRDEIKKSREKGTGSQRQ